MSRDRCCILSKFYIKPQHAGLWRNTTERCILSKFYIKPQLKRLQLVCLIVVSYRNSTSNHNVWLSKATHKRLYLIEILHQTTTCLIYHCRVGWLYLIEILHQTTTIDFINARDRVLYLIEILHQTTTYYPRLFELSGLYLIEILHQTTTLSTALLGNRVLYLIEILHQTTTCGKCEYCLRRCILSKFYIKPQQGRSKSSSGSGCILSKFYIKPQHPFSSTAFCAVVSYRNSTSNHNSSAVSMTGVQVVSYRNSTSNHNKSK